MINDKLFHPKSIIVVGASNKVDKPGGKIIKNLVDNNFRGSLIPVNIQGGNIQGFEAYTDVRELSSADLAILAVPANVCPKTMELLAQKGVSVFIVISAGFSEEGKQGEIYEQQMVDIANRYNACLIGPNCIGVLTPEYAGVFTSPIPKLKNNGVDFISGSGATAVFIIESAISKGLQFHSVISVGNSAQHGIEDVLAYMDETFEPNKSSKIKLLYIENINDPDKLLYHSKSLIRKGCRIAAIKAGSSNAGSRAAASHTGALSSSDLAVEALFRKAGIVRCYGREELTTVACIFTKKKLTGRNIAIITHAGGPAVMLADALESGGLNIPEIPESDAKNRLKKMLPHGSSVQNPIDFLATGNAKHLEEIIKDCEYSFNNIDAMAVIYGSPGLFPVREAYKTLDKMMKQCSKPIYPILPSVINVQEDVAYFISHGNVNFPDEVLLGRALAKVYRTPEPSDESDYVKNIDTKKLNEIIQNTNNGFQAPEVNWKLLDLAGISRVEEFEIVSEKQALQAAKKIGYPLVMKVVGPLHKSDVGGVSLNIKSNETVVKEFHRLINIKNTTSILMAPMLSGTELFIGAKYEKPFGHVVMCGLGGIFVEVLKDVTSGLAPLNSDEAMSMIKNLRARKILDGYRGNEPVKKTVFANMLVRLSAMLRFAPQIKEIDINPLMAKGENIVAVDVRIRIDHNTE